MNHIIELGYSCTNTYLIRGSRGSILLDTGWAGAFPAFCRALGEAGASAQEIRYVLITHFHPDHMGIAQEIADLGAVVLVMDVQRDCLHRADAVFEKEGKFLFKPIADDRVRFLACGESRAFLRGELGIAGEILHTPGHSEDSVSLWLDEGLLFVGDLNPLCELEFHKGAQGDVQIKDSWEKLLALKPVKVYYGHAKAAVLGEPGQAPAPRAEGRAEPGEKELYALVNRVMKYIDKGYPLERIEKKTGADRGFLEDVARMYLTHPGVGVQGILDRIETRRAQRL